MTDHATDYFAGFICLRGDVDNLGLTKEGSFGLRDCQERNWICWQVDQESFQTEIEHVMEDVPQMQENLLRLGYFNTGGARFHAFGTRLPEPIPWEEQLEQLRGQLGKASDDDDEWKRDE